MLKTDNNIAQTGVRILFVLQMLMKSPVSKAQILEKINTCSNLRSVTPDTITLDINTLKAAGFDIKSGNKGNNYCYELKLSPIKIKLTKNELRAISIAKKAMFYFMDFRYIVSIYQTFEKISKLIESKEHAEEILNFGNFLKTDFNLLKELDIHCKHKNEILISYNSPSKSLRQLSVKCLDIKYSKKNDKLYLWCDCKERGGVVYLRADKIEKIIKIVKINADIDLPQNICVYSILRAQNAPLEVEDYEKIIKITPDYVQIRASYLNEFNFIQRLLSFGENLTYVSDEKLVIKLKKIIKNVREMYN